MTAAESSVVEVESLAAGSAWAERLEASSSLVAGERGAAEPIVFPPGVPPVTADLISQFAFFTGRFGSANYDAQCSELHGRAVTDNPALAAMLRSPECLDDVGAAAARVAQPPGRLETHEVAQRRAAVIAIARYKLSAARHLAELDGPLGDAARTILKCADLDARIDAAKQRLEHAAAAEVARVQEEHRAAAEASLIATAEPV